MRVTALVSGWVVAREDRVRVVRPVRVSLFTRVRLRAFWRSRVWVLVMARIWLRALVKWRILPWVLLRVRISNLGNIWEYEMSMIKAMPLQTELKYGALLSDKPHN